MTLGHIESRHGTGETWPGAASLGLQHLVSASVAHPTHAVLPRGASAARGPLAPAPGEVQARRAALPTPHQVDSVSAPAGMGTSFCQKRKKRRNQYMKCTTSTCCMFLARLVSLTQQRHYLLEQHREIQERPEVQPGMWSLRVPIWECARLAAGHLPTPGSFHAMRCTSRQDLTRSRPGHPGANQSRYQPLSPVQNLMGEDGSLFGT